MGFASAFATPLTAIAVLLAQAAGADSVSEQTRLNAISIAAHADVATLIGPAESVEALRSDPDSIYAFIVRGDTSAIAAAEKLVASDPEVKQSPPLKIIDGVALPLRAKDAIYLSSQPGVSQIWYVPRPLIGTYVRVLQSFDYIVSNGQPPEPINMSLGPTADVPLTPHIEEPMNAATKWLSEHGFIPVIAIGNYFDPNHSNPGTINPWCVPEWVICVGAGRPDLSGLWEGSARGTTDHTTRWPDFVADGVDVISAWPVGKLKTADQRRHDETDPIFRKAIPKGKWNEYTMMSGTSQATAEVTRAVTQVVYFVQEIAKSRPGIKSGDPLFSITIPPDRWASIIRGGNRLTGDVGKSGPDGTEVTYRLVAPWLLAKQLLIDTAIPMKAPPNEAGAGFVSPEYIVKQFGQYGVAQVQIIPIKAID